MNLYFKNTHDLMCDMKDGKPPFKLGWVQNTNYTQFYCLCSWMTDIPKDVAQRPWLHLTTYPEEHIFDTESEAMQALVDAGTVAVIGGFRGRG
jgi:hypothetical protein